MTVVPSPTWLATESVPRWSATISRTIASPRPKPDAVSWSRSKRVKRSKMRGSQLVSANESGADEEDERQREEDDEAVGEDESSAQTQRTSPPRDRLTLGASHVCHSR